MAMTEPTDGALEAQWLKWRAVAELYHAYFTGLILTVVTRPNSYSGFFAVSSRNAFCRAWRNSA
jgi:hypothetical protein